MSCGHCCDGLSGSGSSSAASPATPDRSIQFNDAGSFGGSAGLLYTAAGTVLITRAPIAAAGVTELGIDIDWDQSLGNATAGSRMIRANLLYNGVDNMSLIRGVDSLAVWASDADLAFFNGGIIRARITGNGNIPAPNGIFGSVEYQGDGDSNFVTGVEGRFEWSGAGTINEAHAGYSFINITGTAGGTANVLNGHTSYWLNGNSATVARGSMYEAHMRGQNSLTVTDFAFFRAIYNPVTPTNFGTTYGLVIPANFVAGSSGGWGVYQAAPLPSLFGAELRLGSETGRGIFFGAGSPEGAVTAPPGSLFLSDAAGELWRKASGVGNTGWLVSGGTVSTAIDATAAIAAASPGANGRITYVLTNAAARAVTLPTTPPDGVVVALKEAAGSAAAVSVSSGDAAAAVEGVVGGTYSSTVPLAAISMQFVAASNSWWVI